MDLRPSDIYFSQDSINNVFDCRSNHSYRSIGSTLDDLCEGRCSIASIPTITVVWCNDKWVTADNRRLWVFRQLERLGKCDKVPVSKGYSIPSSTLTSYNGGVSVRVRSSPGGQWHSKPSACKPIPDIMKSALLTDSLRDRSVTEAVNNKNNNEKYVEEHDISNNNNKNSAHAQTVVSELSNKDDSNATCQINMNFQSYESDSRSDTDIEELDNVVEERTEHSVNDMKVNIMEDEQAQNDISKDDSSICIEDIASYNRNNENSVNRNRRTNTDICREYVSINMENLEAKHTCMTGVAVSSSESYTTNPKYDKPAQCKRVYTLLCIVPVCIILLIVYTI